MMDEKICIEIKKLMSLSYRYNLIVKSENGINYINENLHFEKRILFISTFVFILSCSMPSLLDFFSIYLNDLFELVIVGFLIVSFYSSVISVCIILDWKNYLKNNKDILHTQKINFEDFKSKNKDVLFQAAFDARSCKILYDRDLLKDDLINSLIQEYFKDKEYKDKV